MRVPCKKREEGEEETSGPSAMEQIDDNVHKKGRCDAVLDPPELIFLWL